LARRQEGEGPEAASRCAGDPGRTRWEAYTSLAAGKSGYFWDFDGAERDYKRAIALKPSYATAHQWYALHLQNMGRSEEASREIRRAFELDPLSTPINHTVGLLLYLQGDFDGAVAQHRKTLELDSRCLCVASLIAALEMSGDYESAIAEVRKQPSTIGWSDDEARELEQAFKAGGARAYWLTQLGQLQRRRKPKYVSPMKLALVHAQLGDRDASFAFLQEAFRERASGLAGVGVNPGFAPLRSDPRFPDLLRRIGLPVNLSS
jgi:tetratricopeptide (TPR) repeat protein